MRARSVFKTRLTQIHAALNLGTVGLLFKKPLVVLGTHGQGWGWYCQQSEAFTLRLTSAAPLVASPLLLAQACWQPQVGVMTGLPGAPEYHSLASSSCEGFLCVHSTWTGLYACVFRGGWRNLSLVIV